MPTLSTKLKVDSETMTSPNLCNKFSKADLDAIGIQVYESYKRDLESRADWERRTQAAMDLAMQVQKAKTFPWPNCANINFPLVTIAAMQFHARAYPAVINGRSVVQCQVVGADADGLGAQRAERISKHMSWQRLEQDEGWEEDEDRALLNVAIVGCGFKKSYNNPSLGYNVSAFVPAKSLVVNYHARSIESARVKTEIVPLYKNDIHERAMRGTYREDVLEEAWFKSPAGTNTASDHQPEDQRAGTTEPDSDSDTPYTCLEQHCWMDLDDDGYEEPYIITIEETTQSVLRIVARWDREEDVERTPKGRIISITATEYYTKRPFIPSPDGGIYDIGFGVLLGPLNESVNSAINQLFDAGTLSNTAGGFLGRGAKLKGGVYSFSPFGWQRVDATGDDLRKSIYPLPVREPSNVMFQLLGLIIEYTSRISGATDMMVGENPGQNTPAETSRVMMEQGQKIYSAIFKRTWRSMKQEFKKLFLLNAIYMPDRATFGNNETILREDYKVGFASVVPSADPTITSDAARFAQATMLREAAASNAAYDTDEVEKMYLRSLGISNIDTLYKGVASVQQPEDVKITIQKMKMEQAQLELQWDQQEFMYNMQQTVRLNDAKIAELSAKVMVLQAEASTAGQRANVEAFRAAIEAIRESNNHANAQLDRMMEHARESRDAARTSGTIPSLEAPADQSTLSPLG